MNRAVSIIVAAAIATTGCTTLGVLNFRKHPDSGYKDGQTYVVIDSPPTVTPNACADESRLGSDADKLKSAGIETAVATMGINLLVQELRTRADRLAARFTHTYGGRTTTRGISADGTTCVSVYRKVKVGDAESIVAQFLFEIRPVEGDGVRAMQVVPKSVRITHPAAVTSASPGRVKVIATVALTGVVQGEKGPQAQSWVSQAFNFGPVPIGVNGRGAPDTPSTVFLPVPAGSAVTVSVAITETGEGAEHYTSASAALEANRAAVTALATAIIKGD